MPSHTFTRVGAWDESIEANLRSAEAAHREHAVSDEMHAMDYLVYAYLQTARDQAAREVATALEDLLAAAAEGRRAGPYRHRGRRILRCGRHPGALRARAERMGRRRGARRPPQHARRTCRR